MQETAVKQYYVYIMLSQTQTGFARAIRRVTGNTYSHSSIAFDEELKHLYGFARFKYKVPVVAGLVREYPERFALNKVDNVPVVIYRIPVTKEQYMIGANRVRDVIQDPEKYLYNLYAALTYPVFKGFETYKAYTCSEFVVSVLTLMGVPLHISEPAYKYTPEQLMEVLSDYEMIFEGNLLDYADTSEHRPAFFETPNYLKAGIETIHYLLLLVYRRGSLRSLKAAANRQKECLTENKHS